MIEEILKRVNEVIDYIEKEIGKVLMDTKLSQEHREKLEELQKKLIALKKKDTFYHGIL